MNGERVREELLRFAATGTRVEESVGMVAGSLEVPPHLVSRELCRLRDEGSVFIRDPNPPQRMSNYLLSVYAVWFWGVVASAALLVGLVYALPSYPPFGITRYILGFLYVLFIPGYVTAEALYPRRAIASLAERIGVSIGLSMAVIPLLGFLLNNAPWGITLRTTLLSTVFFVLGMALLASYRKFANTGLNAGSERREAADTRPAAGAPSATVT